jgi:hypothetical protein
MSLVFAHLSPPSHQLPPSLCVLLPPSSNLLPLSSFLLPFSIDRRASPLPLTRSTYYTRYACSPIASGHRYIVVLRVPRHVSKFLFLFSSPSLSISSPSLLTHLLIISISLSLSLSHLPSSFPRTSYRLLRVKSTTGYMKTYLIRNRRATSDHLY